MGALELMAEYFMSTQEAHCLLCDNPMKNITVARTGSQGCDGNCKHNREYTKEDLIKLFSDELNKGQS